MASLHVSVCSPVCVYAGVSLRIMHGSYHFSPNTDKNCFCFPANKCLILGCLFVCLQAQKCINTRVCVYVSQGTSTGPNCKSMLLAAVTVGYNLSEPSFALVYVGIKPHTLCGKLKRTISDSTAIHNHLDTLTKVLWLICCVCFFFKEGCLPVCGDLHNGSSHGECISIDMTLEVW